MSSILTIYFDYVITIFLLRDDFKFLAYCSLYGSNTGPRTILNYAGKCSSSSQCADPGAYCDLTVFYPQCHQPTRTSGLCANP